MHRHVYFDEVVWLPLSCTIKSFWELHIHTMYMTQVILSPENISNYALSSCSSSLLHHFIFIISDLIS